MSVFDRFGAENEYPDLDIDGAAARLGKAIACRTINYADHSATDFSEFDRLQALIRESYPNLMREGELELIGHCVLITLRGTDESLLPCLYMSHQDVVPVVAGTEGDWTHDAFSGDIADGFIWGRGALDIKNQVFGELEAAEYLLAHGKSFRRTAYFAFGDDEETLNLGSLAIAQTLEKRGVRLEFVLDEGGGRIESGEEFGAPDVMITQIALMEKGYADLELNTKSAGGHSSKPFGGTSLEHIAQAIADITRAPFPASLPTPLRSTFEALRGHITLEPLRGMLTDIDRNADAIAAWCLTQPKLFPYVTTTIAPTVITGSSSACNVMPQDMSAVINFRINEGQSYSDILEHCRNAVRDEKVSMHFQQANDPSAVARQDGLGYRLLTESMSHFFPGVIPVPSLTVGATDAHNYERICDTCLRCSPFIAETEDIVRGVHGTDERLPVRSYAQGIRVLIRMMEQANI